MGQATFRFIAELNDFLPRDRRDTAIAYRFEHRASIKDMIEAQGVPHPEVDVIMVDGQPVDFDYVVQNGDEVAVYPRSASGDLPGSTRAGPTPPAEARFVLDTHLGKLAAYLRLLGFDTLYRNDYQDETLAVISAGEERILLTRDRNLLKRRVVVHGYFVRATDPRRQVVEVLRHYDLWTSLAAYSRCIRCNGRLDRVPKESVAAGLAPKTRQHYDEFHQCRDCRQVYWKGSHYAPLQRFVDEVLAGEAG